MVARVVHWLLNTLYQSLILSIDGCQVRVTFSEADSLASPSSASLSRKAGATRPMHKKTRSLDSVDMVSINNEDDNFSDTDNEEQWEKESMLPGTTQTTYV